VGVTSESVRDGILKYGHEQYFPVVHVLKGV